MRQKNKINLAFLDQLGKPGFAESDERFFMREMVEFKSMLINDNNIIEVRTNLDRNSPEVH